MDSTVNGSQVIYKVQYGTPGIYLTPFKLILEEPWSKYHDINKTKEMSKRYNNKKKMEQAQMTDEQIKAVMELYKPNFIQKFFMDYFSPIEKTNIVRNTTYIVAGAGVVAGIIFNSPSELAFGLVIGVLATAGLLYNKITNTKRIEQLKTVLSKTEAEVIKLESKYYVE